MTLRAIPGEPGLYENDQGVRIRLAHSEDGDVSGSRPRGHWRLCFWCADKRAWVVKGWGLPDGWREIRKLHGTTMWMCPECVKQEMPE